MHICTRDRRYATATELLLLVVPGAVVLTAPSTVINICRSVDIDYLAQISRFWKAVYTNLRNASRARGLPLVSKSLNALLDSISQMFSYFVDIWENILSCSWSYILQMTREWCSSSTTLQNGQSRSVMGVLGLAYLPRSISNTRKLARSLLIVILYLEALTWYKYGSILCRSFKSRYVLKTVLSSPLCDFCDQFCLK